MKVFTFRTEVWLAQPLDAVFSFFADAHNLERITPPWLQFEVLGQPAAVAKGARIDYRLRVRGFLLHWQSEITAWEPPHRFVDEQRRGPYRLWIHEHRFSEFAGRTRAEDLVRYAVPGGWLVNRLFVGRDIRKIFAYRRQVLQKMFGIPDNPPQQSSF